MVRDFPLSASSLADTRPQGSSPLESAMAALAGGTGTPQPARLAATIMLVRDGARGVEVFMQRRAASMAFAARRAVFPGGSLDPGDRDPVPWAGPCAQTWGQALALAPADAAAVVTAAVRELFEEAGVLLVDRVPDPQWTASARQRLLARDVSLGSLLREAGLVARTDLLGYHAHWITPAIEPRRYDTHFFTALLPAGQSADAETTEAQSAHWVAPERMLTEHRDLLMPPTIVCLEDIAAASRAADLVTIRSGIVGVQPFPLRTEGGWVLRVEVS